MPSLLTRAATVAAVGMAHATAALRFESGDLVFVWPPVNAASPFDRGILATGEATVAWLRDAGGLPNTTNETATHVAMALRHQSGLHFVQATPEAGVALTPEAEFWQGTVEGTVFYHGKLQGDLAASGEAAALLAEGRVGLPYAMDFSPPESGAFYCSSLVEWAYEQASGIEGAFFPGLTARHEAFKLIFEPLDYWTQYYEALGVALPVNATGSNPTELLHSPLVRFTAFERPAERGASSRAQV